MSAAEVRIAHDGRALELVPRQYERAEIERRLGDAAHPIRTQRAGRRLKVDFAVGETLLEESPVDLDWSPDAERAVQNRRRQRELAPQVFERVSRIKQRDPATDSHAPCSLLRDTLDDHQLVNVSVMIVEGGWGTCIFDEQGTGKTLTVIAAFDELAERNEADVLVVVAPKSMVGEWAKEFQTFAGNLYRVAVAEGSRREKLRALRAGADVIVLNYEGAVALKEELVLLAKRTRVILVVDESYNVKNPEAIRTSALGEIREWCERCFVLCGTPAPNSPRDLIAQFDLVDFGFTFAGLTIDEDSPDLGARIRDAMDARGIYTRNLKSVVLPGLPRREFTEVNVELAPVQRSLYSTALNQLVIDLRETTDSDYRRRITSFLERRHALLRICSNPASLAPGYDEIPAKLRVLDDVLPRYVDAGEKVVLWSFYRASLEALAARYSHFGLVRIDGSVADVASRREAIRSFQEDADTRVFLGNPAAAGAGLTLHRARVAIYESMSNQAAHFMQSLDRIHRRGQERDVEYVILLCRGTLEETEYQRLLDKTDAQADVLGDPTPKRPTRQVLLDELLRTQERLETST